MKQLLVLLMLLCSSTLYAQDVIVKKDGSTIVCRVVEVNSSEVIYKKWSDLNGSNYVMDRSLVSAINYGNGKKEILSTVENLYKSGNQNDGMRQMNDKALLRFDVEAQKLPKKVKKLRTIGIIGGVVLTGAGVTLLVLNGANESQSDKTVCYLLGGVGIAGGIACTTLCLSKAHQLQKQINMIGGNSIFQKAFRFSDGTILTSSIDIIKDNTNQKQTLGFGLRYNF